MTKTTKGTATAGNAGQKATAEDAVRLKSWGSTLEALEALQKAYLEVSAEYQAAMAAHQPAGVARAVRGDLEDALRPLEAELNKDARSCGLSAPKLILI